jgi:phosphodiesterase/alkaline phosphatase D-like protein
MFGCTEVVSITAEAPSTPPSAVTGSAVKSTTTATLNGTVNPNGVNTVSWFQYGKTTVLGTETGYNGTSSSSTSNISVSNSISGLDPNTTYYYRLAAKSNAGTTYGDTKTFKTDNPTYAPATTLNTVSNPTSTSVTFSGTVNPGGATTYYLFEYSRNSNFSGSTNIPSSPENIGSGTSNVSVSKTVSDLLPNTTYYYRLYASNTAGTTTTPSKQFTTSAGDVIRLYSAFSGLSSNLVVNQNNSFSVKIVNNSSSTWT